MLAYLPVLIYIIGQEFNINDLQIKDKDAVYVFTIYLQYTLNMITRLNLITKQINMMVSKIIFYDYSIIYNYYVNNFNIYLITN